MAARHRPRWRGRGRRLPWYRLWVLWVLIVYGGLALVGYVVGWLRAA